jgi:hypothetical protein
MAVWSDGLADEHAFDMVPANLPTWLPTAQVSTYDTERFLALMT